ncbi:hypothetical protein DNTS_030385 [Danionella cerebrum]|uniref:Protein kinase domain-containing protein n=1 Tax=Danionella cerebrum TaxID=2873325 RepID=A0A553QWG2_9TELE|nr:hypothetical protein DNTS_030385 [Danionella translucida]
MEIVSRSDLVDLPEELQTSGLAKKYKFWGFHVSSEQDSPLFSQGKSFLHNMTHGKKLRVNKRSVCFDGTVLVDAFQGSLDIGEELLKFKFAKVSVRESSLSSVNLQEHAGLWAGRNTPGDLDALGSTIASMPRLRPIFPDQKPQDMREHESTAVLQPLEKLTEERTPERMHSPTEAEDLQFSGQLVVEITGMKELITERDLEIEQLKEDARAMRDQASLLGQQLAEVKLELQTMKESLKETSEVRHNPSGVNRFSQLAKNVEALRKIRQDLWDKEVLEKKPCFGEDHLLESITIIRNYRVSTPLSLERLEVAWKAYDDALKNLRGCQAKSEIESLVSARNEARTSFSAALEDFLQEVDKLPITERLNKLKDVASSLMAICHSATPMEKEEFAFERFLEWKEQKQQKIKSIQKASDEAILALSSWAARLTEFLCLTERTSVTEEDVAEDVEEILMHAHAALFEEIQYQVSEPDSQEKKIVMDALNKALHDIQKEKCLLEDLQEKYKRTTKLKQEVEQWRSDPPKADELFAVKKRIRSLRSQLRWKLVEVSCLEEAEELDLPEILKKKEEITETRNALFQEISCEKQQYIFLCDQMTKSFPELPMLYPDADINGYINSGGLLIKSLDRDMFDAEPMREQSGRRPLLSTYFQRQKVVLKCYAVNEESEVKMLDQAAQYYRVQQQNPSTMVPLLALFCGKEIRKVMRGVANGLQALHAASLIHASLHPNNIFVISREKGLVGDYDFTKTPEQRVSESVMVAGSIGLLAPELKQSQSPSPASDMFAFGGILLWLHAPDLNGAQEKEPQNVELDGLELDVKLQTFLSKLIISSTRLCASEALQEDYFISGDI